MEKYHRNSTAMIRLVIHVLFVFAVAFFRFCVLTSLVQLNSRDARSDLCAVVATAYYASQHTNTHTQMCTYKLKTRLKFLLLMIVYSFSYALLSKFHCISSACTKYNMCITTSRPLAAYLFSLLSILHHCREQRQAAATMAAAKFISIRYQLRSWPLLTRSLVLLSVAVRLFAHTNSTSHTDERTHTHAHATHFGPMLLCYLFRSLAKWRDMFLLCQYIVAVLCFSFTPSISPPLPPPFHRLCFISKTIALLVSLQSCIQYVFWKHFSFS